MAVARIDTPLKQELEQQGRRQDWLAREVGVNISTVWEWVHGIKKPSPDNQRKIAKALGRKLGDLFPAESAEKTA